MKLLVTGAGGFAGKNFIEYLLAQGHEVTGIVRAIDNKNGGVPGCKLIARDLSREIDIDGDFDAIIHTACARSGDYLKHKHDNTDSMEQLISFARRAGISTIINMSTRSIYGEVRVPEVFETTDIINPDDYGLTKYGAEVLLREAYDINGISLRVPGISGPGAHGTWLVNTVREFMNNEPVTISDFETKNFVWVTDIVKFAEKLISKSIKGERFLYDEVNLACREGENNIRLADEIKRRTGSSSVVTVVPPGPGLFLLNSDRAYSMGYESHTPMEITDMYLDTVLSG